MSFTIRNWHYKEDEVATIHWVASPVIKPNGSKMCEVYFRNDKNMITLSSMPWGFLPELWIGKRLVNGVPLDDNAPSMEQTIPMWDVRNVKCDKAKKLIPYRIYPLKIHLLFDEMCCSFEYDGYTYVVPCVEIVRAVYAQNTVLANYLISTGSLEDLFDVSSWQEVDKKVRFDFLKTAPGVSRKLAEDLARIYGTSELYEEWKRINTQYVAMGKIKARLPKRIIITVSFEGKPGSKTRFVHAVRVAKWEKTFERVDYGPEIVKHTGKDKEKSGMIHRKVPFDDNPLDVEESLSKLTRIAIESESSGGAYCDRPIVRRIRNKENTAASVRVIEEKNAEEVYSVGDVSRIGRHPFVSIELRSVEIETNPDFTAFCAAIAELGKYADISILGVSYAALPPGKKVSCLNLSGGRARQYACVVLHRGSNTWLIFELCNKDGYPISTLFTKCKGKKEELVNQIVDKLLKCNGSWSKSQFPNDTYKTLDHYRHRSTQKWAALMYEKMT